MSIGTPGDTEHNNDLEVQTALDLGRIYNDISICNDINQFIEKEADYTKKIRFAFENNHLNHIEILLSRITNLDPTITPHLNSTSKFIASIVKNFLENDYTTISDENKRRLTPYLEAIFTLKANERLN